MTSVSRPLIGLLVATVAFFAVWTIALKPSKSSGGGSSSGTTAYQSAIDKAHQAVKTSDAASATSGGSVATAPTRSAAGSAATATAPAHTAARSATGSAAKAGAATAPAHAARTATQRQNIVNRALLAHKVVAVLFFNPRGADDKAVRQELATVPTHSGRVVKLAVPLAELTRYPVITHQVPITGSPTLVLIDRSRSASTIVGFSDRFEISQRVDQALAVQ